jgi:hypothetical protein
MTLKVTLPKKIGVQAKYALMCQAKEALLEFSEGNNYESAIGPYLPQHMEQGILLIPLMADNDTFPTQLGPFKGYCNNARPNAHGGDHYMMVHMYHNSTLQGICANKSFQCQSLRPHS